MGSAVLILLMAAVVCLPADGSLLNLNAGSTVLGNQGLSANVNIETNSAQKPPTVVKSNDVGLLSVNANINLSGSNTGNSFSGSLLGGTSQTITNLLSAIRENLKPQTNVMGTLNQEPAKAQSQILDSIADRLESIRENTAATLNAQRVKGTKCEDVKIESPNSLAFAKVFPNSRRILSVTVTSQLSLNLCILGKTVNFDAKNVYLLSGCRGFFKVCYELDKVSSDIQCIKPYVDEYGYCVLIEKDTQRKYLDAAGKCDELGGRLLIVGDLIFTAAGFKDNPKLRGRKFFIGGGLFDNALVARIAEKYKLSITDCLIALKRFSGSATVQDMNHPSPLSSLCLAMDFQETQSITLVDCNERWPYICERVPPDDDTTLSWTAWINSKKANYLGPGDDENVEDIAKAIDQGLLADDIVICQKPVDMQCRAVGTLKLYNLTSMYGLVLDKACTYNGIKCLNSKQKLGVKCPDFEVRFLCPRENHKDCAVDSVRKECERQRKECVMSVLGAVCVQMQRIRTGKEKIGFGACTMNAQTYRVFECSSKGDPHYYTCDGTKIDFQGECSYNLLSTCNKYVETNDFPAFSIISMNQKNNPNDTATITKAFYFKILGVTYFFTRGKFYVNGLERVAVGFKDDVISITALPKGDTFLMTIDTAFCLQIRWDNKQGLYIYVPEIYMRFLCGILGNFDGDPSNDMTIPGSNVTVSADKLGRYHMVGGEGADGCTDIAIIPKECTPESIQRFSDRIYCGVLNPNTDSPFVAIVLNGSDLEALMANKASLLQLYKECLQDHCWLADFNAIGRCHKLESIIETIRLQLAIRNEGLDSDWRRYADCEKSLETQCGGRPNTNYSSSFQLHCQDTCTDRVKSITCHNLETSQGCTCKKGFYLDANLSCVPADKCDSSCVVTTETGERVTLEDGSTLVVEPCRKSVTCKNGVSVEQMHQPCSENGECGMDGLTCACRTSYKGNGTHCFSDLSCRAGYVSFGSKCYKFNREKLGWHEAAIYCGADGAQLARYDTDINVELERFLKKVPEYYLLSIATSRSIQCGEGSTCSLPKNQAAISVRVKNSVFAKFCEGKVTVSDDGFQVTIGLGCKARDFIVETVDAKNFFLPLSISCWVGGNTDILGPNKRNGKPPFQVDPPRLIDPSNILNYVGCFQAGLNAEKQFVLTPGSDCKTQRPSICEYDNTRLNRFDPYDFKGIPVLSNYQEAIKRCAAIGRPLATIKNMEQLQKAFKVITDLGNDGWLSLHYDKDENDFLWSTGQKLTAGFTNFKSKPEPNLYGNEFYCVSISRKNGYWNLEVCQEQFFPLCGPPVDIIPIVFSPFYHVDGFSSLAELIQNLQRQGKQDYLCRNPAEIECSAQAKSGQWITNRDQQGTTITCRAESIKCRAGQEFDCATFRVRFMCPQNSNQCNELKALGANPCDGGRECFPISNHFVCQCPRGSIYNEHKESCSSFCGECSAWGDPHFSTYRLKRFGFMGTCKYKFTGVCSLNQFGTSPSFDVYIKNVVCGDPSASCLSKVEIQLRNIPVIRNGAEIKESFNFVITVGASAYKLNNVMISQLEYGIKGVFSTVVKKGYFELIVYPIDLSILLSGSKLKVQIPELFKNKMCGLCGDCGSDLFKLRNGSAISVPGHNNEWDKNIMAALASDWKEFDPEASKADCEIPVVVSDDKCSGANKTELAKANLCGVFLDKTSSIQEGFTRTTLDPQAYFNDCMYDACMQKDPQKAVCTMVKAYAQECSSRGVFLDWRRDHFCPMDCGKKVYRADASCEPTCGRSVVAQQVCQEAPEEGCVCLDGLLRQGENCVQPQDCGCVVYLANDTITWILPPRESFILPNCVELVYCDVNEDGSTTLIHKPFNLPVNTVCNSQIPPTVECVKGFSKDVNGTCQRDPAVCRKGFEDIQGVCLKMHDEIKTWRAAIQACNEEDGTLVNIDSDEKMVAVEKILTEKKLSVLYISGKVRALVVLGAVLFQLELNTNEQGKVEWANFHLNASLLNKIKLSASVSISSIPAQGLVLALVVKKTFSGLSVEAIASDTKAYVICQERQASEEDMEWYSCNNDADMSDDGDHERFYDMLMNPSCLVCPLPLDLRCNVNPKRVVNGSVEGTCQFGVNGEYYTCNEGLNCIDKSVSTKCARDANECATGRHDCLDRTVCVNTVGSYSCKCQNEFPLMVNGRCQAISSCILSGPATPLDYVYNLQGFSGILGYFDVDCKFKLLYICDNSNYNPKSGVPYISFYIMSSRNAGSLEAHVTGSIYDPITDSLKRWGITQQLLSEGHIMIGDKDKEAVMNSLSFIDKNISTRFQFLAPGTLIIRHTSNYFKATISFPTRIQIELSDDYKDLICGACNIKAEFRGAKLVLTEQEVNEISVLPEAPCAPRVMPTLPPTLSSETPFYSTTQTAQKETTPELSTPQITHNASTTESPILPVETLAPATLKTEPPLPFETMPPFENGTLSPITTTRSINYGEPFPTETQTTPAEPTIPPDPDLDDCNDDALLACGALKLFFNVSLVQCREAICSGKLTICQYLAVESFYSFAQSSEMKEFLKLEKCDNVCGANMQFKYTLRSHQPTCVEPKLSTAVRESSDGDYSFACVCDEGFVLSRTECVRESDCGCVLISGVYHSPGSQWRSDDCHQLKTCLGNNEIDTQKTPCGENTQCVLGVSGHECQCLNGLYGNPEMPQGCQPGEVSPDGSKTCYVYVMSDGQNETRCVCNLGFVSNCDDCEDIDECKEGLHDCDLSMQKCINVPGKYQCGCGDGYADKNRECVDVNECHNDSKICVENSQCRNTEGSYECICCAGYLWNPETLSCERELISFKTLPDNSSCCALCIDAACEESESLPSPICYTENGNRTQFPTYKRMYQERCINNLPLNKDNIIKGNCPVDNPAPSNGSGLPPLPTSCDDPMICRAIAPPPPGLSEGPVCGPSNAESPKSYPSYCDMARAVCKSLGGPTSLPRDTSIKASPGECSQGNGPTKPPLPPSEPIFTIWGQYSPCIFKDKLRNCGEGTQVKNRQVVPYDDFRPVRQVESYETSSSRPCFVACVNVITGSPEGPCPEPSFCNEVSPTCGSVGAGAAKDFKSECELNVTACQSGKVAHKLYPGSCDPEDGSALRRYCEEAGPVPVAMKLNNEKDGQHCVGEHATMGSCGDLLCEGEAGTCCKATKFEQIQVDVQCYSLSTRQATNQNKHIYISATECKCQADSP